MDVCAVGQVTPVRLDELGEQFRRYRLRVPQAVQAMAVSLRRWGQCAPIVATLREETRGAHWRDDFPDRDDEHWRGHLDTTLTPDGSLTTRFAPFSAAGGADSPPGKVQSGD